MKIEENSLDDRFFSPQKNEFETAKNSLFSPTAPKTPVKI